MKKITLISLVLVLLCLLVSCNGEVDNQLWNNESWIGKVELSNDFRTSKTDASELNAYTQAQKVFYIKETNATRKKDISTLMNLFEDPECTKPAQVSLRISYQQNPTTPTDSKVRTILVWSTSTNIVWEAIDSIPTEWNVDTETPRGIIQNNSYHFTITKESKTLFDGTSSRNYVGTLKLTFKKGVKFDISSNYS